MNHTLSDTSRNSDRSAKIVQALASGVLATVSVIAVTILNRQSRAAHRGCLRRRHGLPAQADQP
jgi:hypothetical protein